MKFTILFAVIGILGFVGFVYMHEFGHQEIYRSYNLDSEIDWFSHFPVVRTMPEKDCPITACTVAQNFHDTVGYHLMPVYFLILFFGFVVLIVLEKCLVE